MLRRLLVVLVCATLCWQAPAKVLRRSGLATAAAVTETETFDTAVGYDLVWTETIGGLTALNEDKTGASCLTSECLEISYPAGFASGGYTKHDMLSGLTTVYFRFYIYISADGLTDQRAIIFRGNSDGGTSSDGDPFGIHLKDVAGTLSVAFIVNGSEVDSVPITVTTSVRVEVTVNTIAGIYDWRINGGASEGSGTFTADSEATADIYIGVSNQIGGASATTFSIDKVSYSDQTWVGP